MDFTTAAGTLDRAGEIPLSPAQPTSFAVKLWHDAIVWGKSFVLWLIPLLLTLLVILLLRWMTRRRNRQHTVVSHHRMPKITLATAVNEETPAPIAASIPVAAVVPVAAPKSESQPLLAWSNEKQNFDQWHGWYFITAGDVSPSLIPFVLKYGETKTIRTVWEERPGVLSQSMAVAHKSFDPSPPAIMHPEEPAPPASTLPTPIAIAIEETRVDTLLDRLESLALAGYESQPAFFIEGTESLPGIACPAALPQPLLDELEVILLDAMRQREPRAEWLLVQILMMRMALVSKAEADSIYAMAVELTRHSMDRTEGDEKTRWQARLIDLELAGLARQKGATRLLGLRNLQARYAMVIQHGDGAVLQAWIGALLYWAQCQIGDGALSKYTETEAICRQLEAAPGYADEAQRLHVKVLVQRAAVEQGGVRAQSLDAAQALIDELFARLPTAEIAIAVATTSLARAMTLSTEQAKQAYSHALMHAFLADSHPRWRAESLQCRLAIQLAYEALPDMPVQGRVALDLTSRLEVISVARPETLHRMAQTYLRHADFARACQLCEEAWRSGTPASALMDTWQEASRQWAAALPQSTQDKAWQASERLRRNAAHSH
ncbi:hypothetical protein SAMN05216570_1657 [Dyella sp. OK004]|nr:hypothetical protein SAMN05216570_1657 [Dyella sp. OK004]